MDKGQPPPLDPIGMGIGGQHVVQQETMRYLRSENIVWNMLVAIMLPILMQFGIGAIRDTVKKMTSWFRDRPVFTPSYAYRIIEEADCIRIGSVRSNLTANQFLMHAIRKVLSEKFARLDDAHLDMCCAVDDLNNIFPDLRNTAPHVFPKPDVWTTVAGDLQFLWKSTKTTVQTRPNESAVKESISFRLRAKEIQTIDEFVQQCIDSANKSYYETRDLGHIYSCHPSTSISTSSQSSSGGECLRAVKLALRQKKGQVSTFDGLFFPQKESLIAVLDDFLYKRGIYSIPEVRHKLVICLYGIPGSGKSCLIQAIASYLGRENILYVPEYADKRQFYDFVTLGTPFFKNARFNQGSIDISNSLHVFEEIEKTSYYDVLCTTSRQADAVKQVMKHLFRHRGPKWITDSNTTDDCEEGYTFPAADNGNGNGNDNGDLDLPTLDSGARTTTTSNSGESGGSQPNLKETAPLVFNITPKIQLVDFLNLLDGSRTNENQVFIFTSNLDFPKEFNPILTRPGRFDLMLKMDHMLVDDARNLCRYYLKAINNPLYIPDEIDVAIHDFILNQSGVITPAELIAICRESLGEINAFTAALRIHTEKKEKRLNEQGKPGQQEEATAEAALL